MNCTVKQDTADGDRAGEPGVLATLLASSRPLPSSHTYTHSLSTDNGFPTPLTYPCAAKPCSSRPPLEFFLMPRGTERVSVEPGFHADFTTDGCRNLG